jgi:hypothetical protein
MFLSCQLPDRGVFLDVEACLKFFFGVFWGFFVWCFSMLSDSRVPVVCSPDCGHYIRGIVDGVECLD